MSNVKILILEDSKERVEQFITTLSSKGYSSITVSERAHSVVDLLKCEEFQVLYLDNDLGSYDNGSGTDVARFLVENAQNYEDMEIIIHSWNSYARKIMLDDLSNANLKVRAAVFDSKSIPLPLLY